MGRRQLVKITISNAMNLRNVENLGKSDPYCLCEVGPDMTVKTPVITNDLNPKWDYTCEAEWDGSSDIVFVVYDSNSGSGKDTEIGRCSISMSRVLVGFHGPLPLIAPKVEAMTGAIMAIEIGVQPQRTLQMTNVSTVKGMPLICVLIALVALVVGCSLLARWINLHQKDQGIGPWEVPAMWTRSYDL
eukprot:gnl/TRDRNA2_/TRDRNA2_130225_c0_seq4.p1 gnl/TRDRNA2_/TRDRNA2_130225_c0~~gnl/TRDRNA2_/TRDRNA2_130225_c0_seq4.p1  ORF type:complete len:218 (+),score=19.36 gnl/TRDRNA2_/TRDRNA2_130225_c0_seq4:93-656(+)